MDRIPTGRAVRVSKLEALRVLLCEETDPGPDRVLTHVFASLERFLPPARCQLCDAISSVTVYWWRHGSTQPVLRHCAKCGGWYKWVRDAD